MLVPALIVLAVLLVGLGLYSWLRSKKIERETARMASLRDSDPTDELRSLGISEVRPASSETGTASVVRQPDDTSVDKEKTVRSSSQSATEGDRTPSVENMESDSIESDPSISRPGRFISPTSSLWDAGRGSRADSVAFLLESIWASLAAQSVALLRFNEAQSGYILDALISHHASRRVDAVLPTGTSLEGVDDDGSISMLDKPAIADLKFYRNPTEHVGCAAAVAVHWPDERVVLVADRPRAAPEFSSRKCDLLGDYADMLGRILSDEEGYSAPLRDRFDAAEPDREREEQEAWPSAKWLDGDSRPRIEIIAEEMERARRHEKPLALALVVPRDADTISQNTHELVDKRREELFAELHEIDASTRIERFGDVMAGVFFRAGPAFVENWAERVEERIPDLLIGAALLRARHADAESFRADASKALHEAYEREEDCVIID